MIETGQLNRRIKIQAQSTATKLDAFQQPTAASWETVYECWASIDIQASQLIYSTAEWVSNTAIRITIRWTPSVIFNAAQRIVYKEPATGVVHTYQIKTVTNDKQANVQIMFIAYELNAKE